MTDARIYVLATIGYVKVDMLDLSFPRARATIEHCRRYCRAQLIAQRLESDAMLMVATNLGFDLFQGHALGRPHLLTTHSLQPARLHRLRLLTELAQPDPSIDQIIGTVQTDPALALRILRGRPTDRRP